MFWLSYLDIFGTTFSFTTFNNKYFRTSFGGLLSLICGIIAIVFTMLLGRNFFYKSNPIIITQTVNPIKYSPSINITAANFPIAWQLQDVNNNYIDPTNVIFPLIKYFKFRKDNITNSLVNIEEKILDNIFCNVSNANSLELNLTINYTNWNCFDWSNNDVQLGGFWDGDYMDYFSIDLYYCPNGQNYQSDIGCTSYDEFLKFTQGDRILYFSLMYPQVYFDPISIESPLKISYHNYYFAIDPSLKKTDNFFFQKSTVNDDVGWLLTETKEYSEISFIQQKSEYNFFGPDSYSKEGISSYFYEANFYSAKEYQIYNRSYMKLQDLCAVVGGFLKIILLVGEMTTFLVNDHYKNEYLSYELFEFNGNKRNVSR